MRLGFAVCVLSAASAQAQLTTKLSPETAQAYERYVAGVEPTMLADARKDRPLPWLGDANLAALRRGEVVIRSITPKNAQEVRDGLIHDWVAAVFIPGATLEKTAAALQNFEAHEKWYPEIIDSKLISRDGAVVHGRWTMLKKKVITVVLRAELESRFTAVSAAHGFIRSHTTKVTEVQDHGTAKAREYPPGQGHGFLWKFNGYWTVHQASDGVYAECRVISLSRDIPSGLGWIIGPFVRSMPRESLLSTMQNTKKALQR